MNPVFLRIIEIIKQHNEEGNSTMQRLVLKHPPSTRALLGAVLEFLKTENLKY